MKQMLKPVSLLMMLLALFCPVSIGFCEEMASTEPAGVLPVDHVAAGEQTFGEGQMGQLKIIMEEIDSQKMTVSTDGKISAAMVTINSQSVSVEETYTDFLQGARDVLYGGFEIPVEEMDMTMPETMPMDPGYWSTDPDRMAEIMSDPELMRLMTPPTGSIEEVEAANAAVWAVGGGPVIPPVMMAAPPQPGPNQDTQELNTRLLQGMLQTLQGWQQTDARLVGQRVITQTEYNALVARVNELRTMITNADSRRSKDLEKFREIWNAYGRDRVRIRRRLADDVRSAEQRYDTARRAFAQNAITRRDLERDWLALQQAKYDQNLFGAPPPVKK